MYKFPENLRKKKSECRRNILPNLYFISKSLATALDNWNKIYLLYSILWISLKYFLIDFSSFLDLFYCLKEKGFFILFGGCILLYIVVYWIKGIGLVKSIETFQTEQVFSKNCQLSFKTWHQLKSWGKNNLVM